MMVYFLLLDTIWIENKHLKLNLQEGSNDLEMCLSQLLKLLLKESGDDAVASLMVWSAETCWSEFPHR